MAQFNPRTIEGPWAAGYVLDLHTISSVHIGFDEFGHERWDTKRSEIGELLYQLKYRGDKSVLSELTNAATSFIRSWKINFSVVVPVPPTKIYRTFQPVLALAGEIGNQFKVPLLRSAIRKTKRMPELKNVYDAAERKRLLTNAFELSKAAIQGQRILLVDDLYRSGATMSVVTEALVASGASEVYAFAFTQARKGT